MVQFTSKEGQGRLVRAALNEIRPSPEDGKSADEASCSAAVKQILRGVDTSKSCIVASINCPETAIKTLTVPFMPKAELRQGIMLEAKNYFPFQISDSMISYEILSDIVENGVRKYKVVVAVSPASTVRRYLTILEKAGVKPSAFIPSVYALQKNAARPGVPGGSAVCHVDIGELHTELVICKGMEPIFSRKLPVAGIDFTRAMTGTLISDRGKTQLSFAEAERMKREVGLSPEPETRMIEDKISSVQLFSMLRAPAEQLVSEIERCLDYCREELGGEKVERLFLYGGGSSLKGLNGFLSSALGIEVKMGGIPDGISSAPGAFSPDGTAHRIELALGSVLSDPKNINLLPPEIKDETKIAFKKGTVTAVATAAVIVMALFYAGLNLRIDVLQKRIAAASMEYDSLQSNIRKAEALIVARRVMVDEPQWEDVFKELSNLIPDGVHLEEIKMSNYAVTMRGIVAIEDGEQVLSNFVLSLENGLFSDVKLVRSKELEGQKGLEFEIKFWVDYENI
jgi:type IV pilus assembly protein PilM